MLHLFRFGKIKKPGDDQSDNPLASSKLLCELSQKRNEGVTVLVFICALVMSSSLILTGCFTQKHVILNKTVLKVNGTTITTQEFAERLAVRLRDYDALHAKDDANLNRAKEETAQGFILEVIAKDFASKNGLTISKTEVDSEVQSIRSKYPDELAFKRAMADENMSLETWKDKVSFTLLQRKIFKKLIEKIPEIKDDAAKAYYDSNKALFQRPAQIRLRQVVLEKEDDAKRVYDDLLDGGDLAKLAKKFSIAPEATNGGDTGWVEKGVLDVFDQAFKLPIGGRSKIVKSPYGYHIYEVLKKEPEGRLSFNEAKDKIRAQMREKAEQKLFSAWLEEQVRHASVQRNDALISAIKVTTRGS